jgi:hypothetical protein
MHALLARSSLSAVAVAAAAALAACGSPDPQAGAGGPPSPVTGAPLVGLAPGAWNWVEFPDSACDDGSPTGLGVNPGPGPDLVVVLDGGGACWDYLTCVVLGTSSHGPFDEARFRAMEAGELAGSILDRALPGNPFKDATLVFVPYCTGDIHGGSNVAVYTGPGDVRTVHHVGHANVVAFLRRLAATWPTPRKLVVSGASAGGFGSVVNYPTFRSFWPDAQAYLVDDSGPTLVGGAVPTGLLLAWYESWRLDLVLDPLCGVACRGDLSAGLSAVLASYPGDRMALLSSLQDQVISGYFVLGGPRFQEELLRLAADVLAPAPNARYFFVAGSTHPMLDRPAAFSQGVPLVTWLGQQVADDPAWTSRQP